MSDVQLDTKYRNWTIRQITHHVADSHVHSYIRFKWALTEDRPTIKAYEEGDWAALTDARNGNVEAPLALLEALHGRWIQLLRTMTPGQFGREFIHGQTGDSISLDRALGNYVWHGKHHLGQIQWLVTQMNWR
jgi:hypothetical protein